MAKGQLRKTKEPRKPKKDAKKAPAPVVAKAPPVAATRSKER